MILNSGDLITEFQVYEAPFERKDVKIDHIISLRNLILDLNFLLFFKKNKGLFVNLGNGSEQELISLLNSKHIWEFLNTMKFIITDLQKEQLKLSKDDWRNLTPFLIDYSFRKGLERIHNGEIRFTFKGGVRRLFFEGNYVVNDPKIGIYYLLGAEYAFIPCNHHNFSLGLDYSPYQDLQLEGYPSRFYNLEIINPTLEERFVKNNKLLITLFNGKEFIMHLGELCFKLPPKFLKIDGPLVEVDV